MKVYKLKEESIPLYVNKVNGLVGKIIAFALIIAVLVMLLPLIMTKNMEMLSIYGASMLFTGLVVAGIYHNNKKFSKLCAENLEVIITADSITRKIDMENETRMNFFHKFSFNGAKHTAGFYTQIPFNNIKSIETKNGDIWVKAKNFNMLNGQNMLVISQYLHDFDELEKLTNELKKTL
ncbi:MAG TPA: hypothetical protein VK154_09815 [Chitinophagales bacterium]|nr:hypothetical protein [Chitinophagales bacterium]